MAISTIKTNITSGNATVSSGIAGGVRWSKIGNVVFVTAQDVGSTTALGDDALICSNLPSCITTSVGAFVSVGDPTSVLRFRVDQYGNMYIHYDGMAANRQYYGTVSYLSSN